MGTTSPTPSAAVKDATGSSFAVKYVLRAAQWGPDTWWSRQ